MDKLRYSIPEAADLLGVSTRTIELRIKTGALPIVRDGRRVLLLAKDIEAYAEGQSNPQLGRAKQRLRIG